MNSSLLIIIVPAFFALLIGVILMAVIWRGCKSASSWARTTAQIKTFGVTFGVPAVIYEYEVDGSKLTGSAIVPGVFAGKSQGTALAKSVYIRADGSLKFPPNAEVDVFYEPKNPSDAALVIGIPPGIWKGIALLFFFVGIPSGIYEHRAWAAEHAVDLILSAFLCGGVVLLGVSLTWLKNYFRSRSFPSTSGHLLKGDVAFSSSGKGGGGYFPVVEFEYQVNGARYQSRQLTSVSFQVLKPQADAQSFIDRLCAEPNITVYYDPQAPWVGFLQHSSVWSVFLPALMGLVFLGGSVALCFHLHRH